MADEAPPHQSAWLWTGSALLVVAGIVAGGYAARATLFSWTALPMWATYLLGAAAVLCLFAGVRGRRFPLARREHRPANPGVGAAAAPVAPEMSAMPVSDAHLRELRAIAGRAVTSVTNRRPVDYGTSTDHSAFREHFPELGGALDEWDRRVAEAAAKHEKFRTRITEALRSHGIAPPVLINPALAALLAMMVMERLRTGIPTAPFSFGWKRFGTGPLETGDGRPVIDVEAAESAGLNLPHCTGAIETVFWDAHSWATAEEATRRFGPLEEVADTLLAELQLVQRRHIATGSCLLCS